MREQFCSKYLPLCSNSQPDESTVKEARNVSSTGREEELHSSYAIGRSFILTACKETKGGKGKGNNVINLVIDQHQLLENLNTNNIDYDTKREAIVQQLTDAHFKRKRNDDNEVFISNVSHKNKKQNVRHRQAVRGVADTGRTSEKYQLGLLYKESNYNSMKEELEYRVIDVGEGKFSETKEALKKNEKDRCGREIDYDEKFFAGLSGVSFTEGKLP